MNDPLKRVHRSQAPTMGALLYSERASQAAPSIVGVALAATLAPCGCPRPPHHQAALIPYPFCLAAIWSAGGNCAVQKAQRVALSGILLKQ